MNQQRKKIGLFGAVFGLFIGAAVYQLITSTFVVITLAFALGVGVAMGLVYLGIEIRHKQQLYRTQIRARTVIVEALEHGQATRGDSQSIVAFDEIYRTHVLEILYGSPDERKAIQQRRYDLARRDERPAWREVMVEKEGEV